MNQMAPVPRAEEGSAGPPAGKIIDFRHVYNENHIYLSYTTISYTTTCVRIVRIIISIF